MLKELLIKDFVLINQAKINFVSGFNVFTGETGSGKSIIIDALTFALGKRTDKTYVRNGKNKSVIEAVFFMEEPLHPELLKIFLENDMDVNEGSIFLTRELYQDGKSTCRINGKLVTNALLKKIGSFLITLYEQNEYQDVLNRENQLDILDSYSKLSVQEIYQTYQTNFRTYKALKEEIFVLENEFDKTDINRELDILSYQIEEIEKSRSLLESYESNNEQIQKLSKMDDISKAVRFAYENIYSKDDNIISLLNHIIVKLETYKDLDIFIQDWVKNLYESLYIIEDVHHSIRDNMTGFEFNQDALNNLMEAQSNANKIFSKYGKNLNEILEFEQKQQSRFEFLTKIEENIYAKREKIANLEKEMESQCFEISKIRKMQALDFEKEILAELDSLGMNNSNFSVEFENLSDFNGNGKDAITFMISFNKGEPIKPFSKIASGGEISRFILAIKNIVNNYESIDTLVFDEVDSGISGTAAKAVGRKLKNMAKTKQVISITHLPQMAAFGDFHYSVSKNESTDSTFSEIKLLDENKRAEELAKMIGGNHSSPISINYAKELLKESR